MPQQVHYTCVAGPGDVGLLLDDLASAPDCVLLESSAAVGAWSRWTVLSAWPRTVLSLTGQTLTRDGKVIASGPGQAWPSLATQLDWQAEVPADEPCPYGPGWLGYVGYEAGGLLERLPQRAAHDWPLPDIRMGFYPAVAIHDAQCGTWRIAWLPEPDGNMPPAAARLADLLASPQDAPQPPGPMQLPATDLAWTSNFTPPQYRDTIRRCLDYIAAGDIFQVNLAQRISIPQPPSPMDIYRAIRRRNPSSHAAFLSFDAPGGRCAIISASPELLLRAGPGRQVLTRPIKGTRPRSGEPLADAQQASELLASQKDQAELAMIVDLMRNDLGRVCQPGSIRVVDRCLEEHPTVFHTVATVTGTLADGCQAGDLLAACFPGGSITGAPKIRAMEIIHELEPHPRGVYTGSIGYVGPGGRCEWNIAIRTIQHLGDVAHLHVGGGIVADSDPQAEYEETLHKARGLLESIAMAVRP